MSWTFPRWSRRPHFEKSPSSQIRFSQHSFQVNNTPKATLEMQLDQWLPSSPDPLFTPRICTVNIQRTHEVSLRSLHELVHTKPLLHPFSGKGITSPQNTSQFIHGMKRSLFRCPRMAVSPHPWPTVDEALGAPGSRVPLVFNHRTHCPAPSPSQDQASCPHWGTGKARRHSSLLSARGTHSFAGEPGSWASSCTCWDSRGSWPSLGMWPAAGCAPRP